MVRHKMNIGDPFPAESHTKTRAASAPLNIKARSLPRYKSALCWLNSDALHSNYKPTSTASHVTRRRLTPLAVRRFRCSSCVTCALSPLILLAQHPGQTGGSTSGATAVSGR